MADTPDLTPEDFAWCELVKAPKDFMDWPKAIIAPILAAAGFSKKVHAGSLGFCSPNGDLPKSALVGVSIGKLTKNKLYHEVDVTYVGFDTKTKSPVFWSKDVDPYAIAQGRPMKSRMVLTDSGRLLAIDKESAQRLRAVAPRSG